MFACLSVLMFEGSNVLVFGCSNVRTFECSSIRMFGCSNAPMFDGSNIRMFRSSEVQIKFQKNVLVHEFGHSPRDTLWTPERRMFGQPDAKESEDQWVLSNG